MLQDWDIAGQKLLIEGTRAWQSGHRDEAMAKFQEIVDKYPERPEGYNKIGVIFAQKGSLDEAEKYFLAALAKDRMHAPALTNLGNIYLERGDLETAIQHYTLAISVDVEYAPAHRNLSVAYRRQGHLNRSVTHLKRSQRLETQRQRDEFRAERAIRAGQTPPATKPGFGRRGFSSSMVWWILVAGIIIYLVLRTGLH
ncbi:MAG: tetratricopeptide repeat protein [Sulfobacillus sp.]